MTARWTCCSAALEPLGFACTRLVFGPTTTGWTTCSPAAAPRAPHFCYAGHTDVVPPGDAAAWPDDPFAGVVRDGVLYGRGACDMKGGIAAFVAGLTDCLAAQPGPAGLDLAADHRRRGRRRPWTAPRRCWNGWQANGQVPDMALVGEPTSPRRAGRHRQDRPARQPERLDHGARHAGPQRLSAARRQPDPPPGRARWRR